MSQTDNPEEWQPWIDEACRAVGVDPAIVETDAVLALTKTVAQRFLRPMAPVAAHILGLAIASNRTASTEELIEALVNTLPPALD